VTREAGGEPWAKREPRIDTTQIYTKIRSPQLKRAVAVYEAQAPVYEAQAPRMLGV
jgi:hypothetical protein